MTIGWAYQRTVDPVSEPLSVDEAKSHARIDLSDEDVDVEAAVKASREAGENYTGRGFVTQTWRYQQDVFTSVISLPMAAPLQSVTSVKYYDTAGVQQTLASSTYVVDAMTEPGRIYLAPNKTWPSLQSGRLLAVEVTYVVGWQSAEQVPALIRQGMRKALATVLEFREDVISGTIVAKLPKGARNDWASYLVSWVPPKCETAR